MAKLKKKKKMPLYSVGACPMGTQCSSGINKAAAHLVSFTRGAGESFF